MLLVLTLPISDQLSGDSLCSFHACGLACCNIVFLIQIYCNCLITSLALCLLFANAVICILLSSSVCLSVCHNLYFIDLGVCSE